MNDNVFIRAFHKLEFKKYRKFFLPAIALALIVNANMNRNSSDSIGTDLWGGVRMGMSEKQLRKTLGKSMKCRTEPEPYQYLSHCTNPARVPVGNEKAVMHVTLHNGKVDHLTIGVNYSNACSHNRYSTSSSACKEQLEQRDRRNFAKIERTLNSKYGKELYVPLLCLQMAKPGLHLMMFR